MPRREHTQSFESYEAEMVERKLTPLERAVDLYLGSKPGTSEAIRLSGLVVVAMRMTRGDER